MLTTERLVLRRWRDADRAPFAALNADPVVMEHFPAPLTPAQSDAFVDRVERGFDDDGFGLWAVELRDTGAFTGFVGLTRPRFEAAFTPAVEIGWRLARPYWGLGLATEGGSAALAYGIEVVGLHEIVSFTAVPNVRSQRVMQRLGMVRDPAEDFDHPALAPGSPLRRHVFYRLTARRWRQGAPPT